MNASRPRDPALRTTVRLKEAHGPDIARNECTRHKDHYWHGRVIKA